MSTEKYHSLKELTPAQEAKCDKIIELLSDLKRCGVHPLIIDGGGGSGLQFIRCNRDDCNSIFEEIINNPHFNNTEESEYIYTPPGSWNNIIETLVP